MNFYKPRIPKQRGAYQAAARVETQVARPMPSNLSGNFKNISLGLILVFASNLLSHVLYNPKVEALGVKNPTAEVEGMPLDDSRLYLMDKASLYVSDEDSFERKVKEISDMLGVRAEWLMAVMYSESKFDAQVLNHRGSGATGLIQFMPATASEMNVSLQRLGRMTHLQQLEYVYMYLQTARERYGNYDSLTDLYLAILYPRARKQEYCYTLYAKPTRAYTQNRGLDENKDGRVTISDIDRRMKRLYPTAYMAEL